MKTIKWDYLFKHWFGTLLLAPLIFCITPFLFTHNHNSIAYFQLYPVFLIMGLLFSIPTYILYSFVYFYLIKNNAKIKFAKPILITFAVIGIFVTADFAGGETMGLIAACYSVASITCGLIAKIKIENNP